MRKRQKILYRSKNPYMNKTIYLRGPTRPVIIVTTRNDGDESQIITNINYDQNSSIFLKQLPNQNGIR